MSGLGIAIIIIAVVVVFIGFIMLISAIKVVPQTNVYIVERFGSYRKSLSNGINFIFPVIDKVTLKVPLKETVLDFPPQNVITKDNVTMQIDTVVYMQVTDPKLYAYGVHNPIAAVENMTATTLRNLVGEIDLDGTLTSRDTINERLRSVLDKATDPWGIKIIRVELKNILPPASIRESMEKQMRAEREKREQILIAEGIKAASILKAEGDRESNIIRAEGIKASLILEAEGKKASLELINQSQASGEALTLKWFESLVDVSKGNATTILIPTDLTDVSKLTTTFSAISETVKNKIKDK